VDLGLNLICPASHQPYVYNPLGLQSPKGGERRLIVYDATPAHHGRRWGITVAPPKSLGVNDKGLARMRPLAMSVVDLSEDDFKAYAPAAAPLAGQPVDLPRPVAQAQPAPAQPAPSAEQPAQPVPGRLEFPAPAPPAPPAAQPAQPVPGQLQLPQPTKPPATQP
jgi:hypothetical protein